MSRLLFLLLGVVSSAAIAQVNVPNPMVRPMPPAQAVGPSGVTPDGLPTPPMAPSGRAQSASMPDPASSAGFLGGADASGANSPATVRALTGGMYVATIMNRRAILRTSAPASGMPGMGGQMQGALPPMQQGGVATPGASGAVSAVPRQISFTVRDGEKIFLMDTLEVTARVGEKTVELFSEKNGKRALVFRGEVDSIALQNAPRPSQTDLQKRNVEYLNSISVSDLGFKGAGAAAGGGSTSTPATGGTGTTGAR